MDAGGLGLAAELTRGLQGAGAADTAPDGPPTPAVTSAPATATAGGTAAPEAAV